YNRKILPATPSAVIRILEELNFKFEGANIAIINHSLVIGKPLAIMLLNRNATVRVCHIYTKNLKENVRNSDVLIVGCGKPNLINKKFVNKDMIVIDCGMNRIGNLLTGDVDFENVKDVVGAITPVPGGVGPVNVAILLRNFIELVIKNENAIGIL
ncbi:MAG: bifunctional methylenetetrahydrofolate dehydrogenase/methenyltetrahydrofolate cyclohydrolase, partial [Candidatus Thermoplasmatota archaeon]